MGAAIFELNQEPLDAYAAARSSSELIELQFEFFDIERPDAEAES